MRLSHAELQLHAGARPYFCNTSILYESSVWSESSVRWQSTSPHKSPVLCVMSRVCVQVVYIRCEIAFARSAGELEAFCCFSLVHYIFWVLSLPLSDLSSTHSSSLLPPITDTIADTYPAVNLYHGLTTGY